VAPCMGLSVHLFDMEPARVKLGHVRVLRDLAGAEQYLGSWGSGLGSGSGAGAGAGAVWVQTRCRVRVRSTSAATAPGSSPSPWSASAALQTGVV